MTNLESLFENQIDLGGTEQSDFQVPQEQQPQTTGVQKGQTMDEFLTQPISPQQQHEVETIKNNNPLSDLELAASAISNLNENVGNPISTRDWKDELSKDATKIKEIPESELNDSLVDIALAKSGYLLFDLPQAFINTRTITLAINTSPEIISKIHAAIKQPINVWQMAVLKQPSLIKELPDEYAVPDLLNKFHTANKGNQWDEYIITKYASKLKANTEQSAASVVQPTQQQVQQPVQPQVASDNAEKANHIDYATDLSALKYVIKNINDNVTDVERKLASIKEAVTELNKLLESR